MLSNTKEHQNEVEFVCNEDLAPEDPLLRKIDKHIDFSFILDKVAPYYCENNGRPSINPIVLFKMMFIGYLYGIRSERQLKPFIRLKYTVPVCIKIAPLKQCIVV